MRIPIIIILTIIFFSCKSTGEEHAFTMAGIPEKTTEQDTVIIKSGTSSQQIPVGYRILSLYSNRIQIAIPDYFTEMSSVMKQLKYPRNNSPEVVYTNDEGTVNIAFRYTSVAVPDNNVAAMENTFLQQFRNVNAIDLKHRVENIDGSDFVVLEFMSQALDTKVYNLLFMTELDRKVLLGTFNCTEALKKQWESKARQILMSIRKR